MIADCVVKGTGKWTAINALDLGQPVTLIGEAVFARCLSAIRDERARASKVIDGPNTHFQGDKKAFIDKLEQVCPNNILPKNSFLKNTIPQLHDSPVIVMEANG